MGELGAGDVRGVHIKGTEKGSQGTEEGKREKGPPLRPSHTIQPYRGQ